MVFKKEIYSKVIINKHKSKSCEVSNEIVAILVIDPETYSMSLYTVR